VRAELLAKGSIESAFNNALGDVAINAAVTTGLRALAKCRCTRLMPSAAVRRPAENC
jgi:hypothetical protein